MIVRIQNPLAHVPQATLLDRVEDFAKTTGLTHPDVLRSLRKGALVARDPTNYEDIIGEESLDDDEIEALRNEVLHKWRQPLALYVTIVTCSIGAAVQGWDETGITTIYFLQDLEMLPLRSVGSYFSHRMSPNFNYLPAGQV